MIHETGLDDTFCYFGNERQIRDWPVVREFLFSQNEFLNYCLLAAMSPKIKHRKPMADYQLACRPTEATNGSWAI